MNTNTTIIISLLLLLVKTVPAAEYDIDWQVIAPAGGTASGGIYTLHDTLGETAAHRTSVAPTAAIDGGFWALWSPTSLGLPELNIVRIDAVTVQLSWSPAGGGWLLQRSADLETWSDLTAITPTDEALAPGGAFYRLILP